MKPSLQNSKKVDLSIIIVSYNTKKLTLQCIKSVLDTIKKLKYEIIIVDNSSDDGTLRLIKNLKLSVKNDNLKLKIIENKENLGFATANNQGIKRAQGKYILLLNSDTIVKKDAIEKLVEFANKGTNVGAVVPKLLSKDGSVQPSVFKLPTISRALRQYWFGTKGLLDKYTPKTKHPSEIESAVMAAFLITPKALEKAGLLNEKYFMYFEDLDYCRGLRRLGLKTFYLPSAEVIHYHGASGIQISDSKDQWRRLVPSSKIYHGTFGHYLFNFVLWSGQKWQNFIKKEK